MQSLPGLYLASSAFVSANRTFIRVLKLFGNTVLRYTVNGKDHSGVLSSVYVYKNVRMHAICDRRVYRVNTGSQVLKLYMIRIIP